MPPGPRPTPPKKPTPKPMPSRPEAYSRGAKIVPGPRKAKWTPPNPPYSVVLGRPGKYTSVPTVRMDYEQKPMGRPKTAGQVVKKPNKGLSKPDRAEGYAGKGKWVATGKNGWKWVLDPNMNQLSGGYVKIPGQKFVTPKNGEMGRPLKGGSGINAKPTPKRKPPSDKYDTTRSPGQGSKPPKKKPAPPKLIDVIVNGRVVKMPVTSPKQGQRGRVLPTVPKAY